MSIATNSLRFNSFYLCSKPPGLSVLLQDDTSVLSFCLYEQPLYLVSSTRSIDLCSSQLTSLLSSNSYGVLIKVLALSTNFRDRGDLEQRLSNASITKYFIGSDFVGKVISIGSSVTHLSVGDHVIPSHTYPPHGIVSVTASAGILYIDARRLLRINMSVALSTAGSFSVPFQTASSLIRRAEIINKPGAHAIITAPRSATSLAVMQILRSLSIPFTILCRSRSLLQPLKSLGFSDVIVADPSSESFSSELASNLSDIFVTHVFDNFPDAYAFDLLPCIQENSVYIFAGILDQGVLFQDQSEYKPSFTGILHRMMVKNIHFIGNCLGSHDDLLSAWNLIEKSAITPVIDSLFSFNEIQAFIKRSFQAPDRIGKSVLHLNCS